MPEEALRLGDQLDLLTCLLLQCFPCLRIRWSSCSATNSEHRSNVPVRPETPGKIAESSATQQTCVSKRVHKQ